MKILYVANERGAAQLLAQALRSIAPNARLTWSGSLAPTPGWVQANRDVAAVIVEATVQGQSCASLLDHVRSLRLPAPVVVVSSDARKTTADIKPDYLVSSRELLAELPAILNIALQRTHQASRTASALPPVPAAEPLATGTHAGQPSATQPPVADVPGMPQAQLEGRPAQEPTQPPHSIISATASTNQHAVQGHAAETRTAMAVAGNPSQQQEMLARAARVCRSLEKRVQELEAALRHAEQQHAAEAAGSVDHLARRHAEFTASLAEAVQSRDTLAQKLKAAMAALEESRRIRLTDAAEADERLARREAELGAALADSAAARTALEQELAHARAGVQQAEQRADADRAAAELAAATRESDFAEQLAKEAAARRRVEENLEAALSALKNSRDLAVEAAAAAGRLAEREAELRAALEASNATLKELERTRDEAETNFENARQRGAADLATAADRQAELEAQLAQEAAARTILEQRLERADTVLREAEQRHVSDLAAAAARLADVQAQHDAEIAEIAAERSAVEQQLTEAETALEGARRSGLEAAAAAERLALREAELGAALEESAAARSELERSRAETEAAFEHAQRRAAAGLAAAATRQAELENRIAVATSAHTVLEQDLADALAAVERLRRARASDAAAAAEHLARREAELGAALEASSAAHATLERAHAEAESAHHVAHERARTDLAAAAARQTALEERLAQETAARTLLEQRLEDAEAARQDAHRRHVSELTEVQAQHDAAIAEASAARAAFEQQLTGALEEARQASASNAAAAAERLARREAELEAALEESGAALERARADLASAVARQAELEGDLTAEASARTTAEKDLSDARAASARVRRRVLVRASAIRRRAREHRTRLEAGIERERIDHGQILRTRENQIRDLERERETLQQSLDADRQELEHLRRTHADEREGYELARAASESELQRLAADYEQIRQSLDQVRAAFATLEHVSSEHAAERARLERVVADRDTQLNAQAERQRAAEEAARTAVAEIQQRLHRAVDKSSIEIAQLQRELTALRQGLKARTTEAEALRIDAERVPALVKQLEESQKEHRRQFDRAPYGLCRCDPGGAITHANRSLARLLGYRTVDDLRKVDFAKTVFESPTDLPWLIERAVSTGTTEWVDLTLRKKNRRRVAVRLQLQPTASGSVDIAVEDVTRVRSLEERLRQTHRMEAVGRLAAEVAATCNIVLSDARQGGEQWLATIGDDPVSRPHAERLLSEVTRAASLLRQLSVYGNEQTRALEPVNVLMVLRDLQPVLKRVAGDDIELVLPQAASGNADLEADVDVEAERVERVLVNVASFARERMPRGGRLQIDVATTVVDSRFVAEHPDVRPGNHVLITVTEVGRTRSAGTLLESPSETSTAGAGRSADDKAGIDLGALLRLIGDCGGHLWMTAEPSGNMTLKIHLPKREPGDFVESTAALPRPARGRSLVKWFRH